MRGKGQPSGFAAAGENREAIARLAQSGEARQLMTMLRQQGGVQAAAEAAAAGDVGQLMKMMEQLVNTREGAALVDRLGEQARKAGLQ